eukprot:334597-Hanusia_phi.AAC.2
MGDEVDDHGVLGIKSEGVIKKVLSSWNVIVHFTMKLFTCENEMRGTTSTFALQMCMRGSLGQS